MCGSIRVSKQEMVGYEVGEDMGPKYLALICCCESFGFSIDNSK